MKLLYMLKSIFSLFLVIFALNATAQTDTINYKKPYGLRVGIDAFKLTKTLLDKNYQGIEVVGDLRITNKVYVAAELGNENFTIDDDHMNFTTKGTYFKVGLDYNAHKNWLDLNNMIYTGIRYGASTFSQTLNSYSIYDASNYYGENTQQSGEQFDGLTANWLEFVAGIKAEVLNNVFIGFSARLNYKIGDKKPTNFDNLYIPGFHKNYGGNIGVGLNYTITYQIPFLRK